MEGEGRVVPEPGCLPILRRGGWEAWSPGLTGDAQCWGEEVQREPELSDSLRAELSNLLSP